ncbi:MAG: hypothetical protein CL878_00350 [Dehalococcoidia bacterium]|nr:hypothetical protein [Dehalococcoidia bacterium]
MSEQSPPSAEAIAMSKEPVDGEHTRNRLLRLPDISHTGPARLPGNTARPLTATNAGDVGGAGPGSAASAATDDSDPRRSA